VNVLLIAEARTPPSRHTAHSIARQAAAGVTFDLVTWWPPPAALEAVTDLVSVLGPRLEATERRGDGSLRARAWSRLVLPTLLWRAFRRDRPSVEAAGRADMIVALDTPATLTAWQLARRLPTPEVIQGFDAADAVLTDRLRRPRG